jgi:hypothetical protein
MVGTTIPTGNLFGEVPKHASSVALVMDLATAHVSLQFHLKFDNLFETVLSTRSNSQAQNSLWQGLCHFGPQEKNSSASSQRVPQSSTLGSKAGGMDIVKVAQMEKDHEDFPAQMLAKDQFMFLKEERAFLRSNLPSQKHSGTGTTSGGDPSVEI